MRLKWSGLARTDIVYCPLWTPEYPSPSWIDQRSKPPALMKTFFRPFTGLRVAALVAFTFFSVMTTPLAAAAAPVQLTWLEQPAAAASQSTS